jgi:hypothetical protein
MGGRTTTGKQKWVHVPEASGPSERKMSGAAMKRPEITTGVLKPKPPDEGYGQIYEATRIPSSFDASTGKFKKLPVPKLRRK